MSDKELYDYFCYIYESTYKNTFKYLVLNVSNLEDVNDLIQEIYFDFYKALTKKIKIDNYSSYILGIANKKISGYYKIFYKVKKVLSVPVHDCNDLKDEFDLECKVFNKIEVQKLIDYINSKELAVARCIYLYYYLDMKIKDIAKELNISESNVKNNIYRTINEYKKIIAKE